MTKREALVRLVAGQMALPDSWRVVHGVTQDGEEVEHCEVFGETIENMLVSAEHALAEIERVSGSPLDDALAAAGLDDVEKLTPWIKSMRIGRAKIEAEQREKDAKIAEEYGLKLFDDRHRDACATIAAAIRGGGES